MVASSTIQLPSVESALALAGYQEENLKVLARQTGATVVLRGQDLLISGTEKQIERCSDLVRALGDMWTRGKAVSTVDILTAQHALNTDRT